MDDSFSFDRVPRDPVGGGGVEFVERKGIGHPDSLCDGVAEAVSRRLSRHYLEEFGRILHHNTDKVHLSAGRSAPAFGGGEVTSPLSVIVGGRATTTVDGESLPIAELATDAAKRYLTETVPELDARHVTVESRIGATSTDLASLFARGSEPLSNDTSFGVAHAPGSPVEQFVRTLEPRLHGELDAVGKDVKLMCARRGDRVSLTVAAAVIDRYVSDLAAYRDVLARIGALAERHAEETLGMPVSICVNAADDYETGSVYLTTTGLSAEAGDDGAVGRGNRANGLITPQRPMSLEATSGKNPVTHVGKLYNLLALESAKRIASETGADYCGVQLLSRIGVPVTEPTAVSVESTAGDAETAREAVASKLDSLDRLTERLVRGELPTF